MARRPVGLTRAMDMFTLILVLSTFLFSFRRLLAAGQTDRRTDQTRNAACNTGHSLPTISVSGPYSSPLPAILEMIDWLGYAAVNETWHNVGN